MMLQKDKEETTVNKRYLKEDHILTVALCAVSIPLSMSMWIANIVYSKFVLQSQALDGFILTLSNYCFLGVLLTFFASSSKATKVRPHLKRKFDPDYKDGGQRNWIQVLCNGGMATQLGLLYLLDVGATERPIDFVKDYRASWLSMGILGVFACCNGDTWASELGTVISESEPYLVTSWKKVPKGTNGGISVVGTLFSALGGFVIGLTYYLAVLYFTDSSLLAYAPPQWPLIVYGTIAGFIGSLVDSYIGAALQYSGVDKDGKIVSHSLLSVKHISGRNILDNHSVNLICTVIMGLLTPTISRYMWPVY
ncbi:transmembrane protein 19 isoform X2 [Plodia interpunctella]|uniref:transmembrane protein 19 isoform X2 n=1 Tax=Plodia interpunctella TaxID=58824 RepID=UPI0023681261|nr:transmembrane protein 19 isoform X2 [Plodia interpunctella]